jgi:ABC-type multidrug transport system fused ATPase/permease subunit
VLIYCWSIVAGLRLTQVLLLSSCRMVEVDPGSILIDGVDIRRLGLKQLRSQMSIIPQVGMCQVAYICSGGVSGLDA